MDRKQTEREPKEFEQLIHNQIHCKLNKKAHIDAIFIEIGQWSSKRHSYNTNSYWYKENIKLLVYGNEKMQFYFNKEKLLQWIKDHPERIGEYREGQTRGISLSLNESLKMADMVIK